MLFKRKLFKKKQLLLKYIFLQKELDIIIRKSLFKNHSNNYMFRLTFTVNTDKYSKLNYFRTIQKLICPYSLSKKVPSKHFLFSRFFLNKRLNSLNISNVYT